MDMQMLCGSSRSGGTAFNSGLTVRPVVNISLLPKRTTVVRKDKLQKQKQKHRTEDSNAHDFPTTVPRDEADLDEDSVMGEVDRPEQPSDKPEA